MGGNITKGTYCYVKYGRDRVKIEKMGETEVIYKPVLWHGVSYSWKEEEQVTCKQVESKQARETEKGQACCSGCLPP